MSLQENLLSFIPYIFRDKYWQTKIIEVPEYLPDDVFFCSYPRSGNTWVRIILSSYISGAKLSDLDFAERFVPDLHYTKPDKLNLVQPPRIMKSHVYPSRQCRKILHLVRDARDVAASYFYYMRDRNAFRGDFSHFVRLMATGQLWPGSWQGHTSKFRVLASSSDFNVLTLKYEDLREDKMAGLRKIIEFCGIDFDEARAQESLQRSDFESYRELGEKRGVDATNSKGVSGRWVEMFSQHDLDLFLRYVGDQMAVLGYEV